MGHVSSKAWSRSQSLIALSTGEFELVAVTKAAAEALGIQSVLADFGVFGKLEIHSDATAAIGRVWGECGISPPPTHAAPSLRAIGRTRVRCRRDKGGECP